MNPPLQYTRQPYILSAQTAGLVVPLLQLEQQNLGADMNGFLARRRQPAVLSECHAMLIRTCHVEGIGQATTFTAQLDAALLCCAFCSLKCMFPAFIQRMLLIVSKSAVLW